MAKPDAAVCSPEPASSIFHMSERSAALSSIQPRRVRLRTNRQAAGRYRQDHRGLHPPAQVRRPDSLSVSYPGIVQLLKQLRNANHDCSPRGHKLSRSNQFEPGGNTPIGHSGTWIDDPDILHAESKILSGLRRSSTDRIFGRHDLNSDKRRMREDSLPRGAGTKNAHVWH